MPLPQYPKLPTQPERGQALVEYVLIVVLVALIFGVALAATGGVVGNVFSNSISDLLRLTGTPLAGIPDREGFWGTVTIAATPAVENPLPTNTPAPPTVQPTDGPPPTATDITPSPTPSKTRTPTLTRTPMDEIFRMPFYDSIEKQNAKWWRGDPNINTSGLPWGLEFYNNGDLSGNAVAQFSNPGWLKIDFTGDGTTPWATGVNPTGFSMRMTRTVQLATDTILTIRVLAADGVRVSVGGNTIDSLDQWNANPNDPVWYSGSVEVEGDGLFDNAIKTEIEVEYRHIVGPSRLYVWVQASAANPDDTYVNDGGQPGAGVFSCGWGQTFAIQGNDSNTELGMWDSYAANPIIPETQTVQDTTNPERNSRCYLELRGGVDVPVGTQRPQLIFWDVWDFQAPVQSWIEVANYEQATDPLPGGTPPPQPSVDRDALTWQRINLHPGGTRNYNWTRQVIDLTALTLDFTKPITFRFVMQNTTSANTQINRWYVDDVRVQDSGAEKRFKLDTPTWTLDNDDQMKDFLGTGGKSLLGTLSGWRLTSITKLGPSGTSFHDSVGSNDKPGCAGDNNDPCKFTDYKRNSQSPTGSDNRDLRIHYLEFNGWVDLDPTVTEDADGNKGEPVVAFYHAYDLGSFTGLEIQWTTDAFNVPSPQWRTFSEGLIRDVNTAGSVKSMTMQEQIILLKDLQGNPQRIRVRFAMKVRSDAVRRDGWWIDNIRIGREETPKWVDYPFKDDAQYFTSGPWRFNGKWGKTDASGRRNADEPTVLDPVTNNPVIDPAYKRVSYSSSPGGQYTPGQRTYMEGRYPLDLKNDTQTDPAQTKQIWQRDANTNPDVNNPNNKGGAAINPVLSFYHWRDLGNSDNIEVQWKRIDAPEADWKMLWVYKNGMATIHTSPSPETAKQRAWEHVEIDLAEVMADVTNVTNDDPANKRDDDVIFRFVLDAKGAGAGDGIYIDDIRIYERPDPNAAPLAFKLWGTTENVTEPILGQALGTGNGAFFTDDADASSTNRFWENSWFNGGNWHAVNYESRIGVYSFHDSPIGGQDRAPDGIGNYTGEADWYVPLDTFNVLELNNIIDLRGVDGRNEAPALYFWSRYHLGGGNIAAVQVSVEMTKADGTPYTEAELDADIRTRCANPAVKQCYEQKRGWTSWETTAWEERVNTGQERRAYGWEREQVDLSRYAYDEDLNVPGKRIRIRFVLNQLTNTTQNRDGWFIDNITIRYREPGFPEDVIVANDSYDNTASSMRGWVGEGDWGLDPVIFEGSGGSPTTFGAWTARWWDCNDCANYPGAGGSYRTGTRLFLDDPARRAPDFTNQVIGINYPMNNGKPPGTPASFPVNRFVGEFVLDSPVVGSGSFPVGNRVLLVVSDDGVRVRMQELVNGNPVGDPPWASCIDNWKDQAPTTSTCTLNFQLGKQYRITIQYYEATQGAWLTANIGEGRYSFSDSPQLSGTTSADQPPLAFANTSLRIDQTLDLRGVSANSTILLGYRTKYRMGPNTTGRVEVSVDGGFTWEQGGLSTGVPGFNFSSPNINNAVIDPNPSGGTTWQQRFNNLSSYRESQILIRFRLDRQNESCARSIRANTGADTEPTKCIPNGAGQEFIKGYFDGWWISRVQIAAQ